MATSLHEGSAQPFHEKRSTRRWLLARSGTAAATATYFLHHRSSAHEDHPAAVRTVTRASLPNRVLGAVEQITSPDSLVVRGDDLIQVKLTDETVLWRDGRVALLEFIHGDEVAAEGEWVADTFVATKVASTMRVVEGHILEKNMAYLRLADWSVQLTPETRRLSADGTREIQANFEDVAVGDRVVVLGRRDHASGSIVGVSLQSAARG